MFGRTAHLFDAYYLSKPGFVDGTSEFHRMCAEHIPRDRDILEMGAGPPNDTTRFLATRGRVVGVDVSDEIATNDALAEWHVYDGTRLPFADRTFGGCVSNYVMEHIADPSTHFSEVARVLDHGGRYVFRTPNLFHYVAAAARFLPHRAHVRLSKGFRGMTDADHDPWRTYYRANRRRTIHRLANASGLRVVTLRMVEKEPSYGRASPLLFFPMMAYERIVNSGEMGASFR